VPAALPGSGRRPINKAIKALAKLSSVAWYPEGPARVAIRKMLPPEIERIKVRLREEMPIAPNGSIS
jgi:hypothetical protein